MRELRVHDEEAEGAKMITQSEWELIPFSGWWERLKRAGGEWKIGNVIQRPGREPEIYVKPVTRRGEPK